MIDDDISASYIAAAVREARDQVKDNVEKRSRRKRLSLEVSQSEREKATLLLYYGYDGASGRGLRSRRNPNGTEIFNVDDQMPKILEAYKRIATRRKYPNLELKLTYTVQRP